MAKAAAVGTAPIRAPGRTLRLVSRIKMGQGDSSGHDRDGAVNGSLPSTGATRDVLKCTQKSPREHQRFKGEDSDVQHLVFAQWSSVLLQSDGIHILT